MKNHIDSNFAIAILALVAACVGFAFWLSADSFNEEFAHNQTVGVKDAHWTTDQFDTRTITEVDSSTYANEQVVVEYSADSPESEGYGVRYSAPGQITSLCDRLGEVQLQDIDGGLHRFRTPAGSMRSYNNEELWIAGESGTDAATFYFDKSGLVIDICQPLFAPEPCEKYEEFSPYDAFDICGE